MSMCIVMDKLARRDICCIPQKDLSIEPFILKASDGFDVLMNTFWE